MSVKAKKMGFYSHATHYGTICLFFKKNILQVTLDGGIHLHNPKNDIILTISKDARSCALFHPNGRMGAYDSRVEVVMYNPRGKRMAKIWHKGITFTTEDKPINFLVDAGGIKTTVDWFINLDDEFPAQVFYYNSRYGCQYVPEAIALLNSVQHWVTEFGQKIWIVGSLQITENIDGFLKIKNMENKSVLYIKENFGSACINTPLVHCTASMGSNGHMFVRHKNCRVYYDGTNFEVRNEGQSASVNSNNQLKIL